MNKKLIIDIPEVFYEYCKSQEDPMEIQLAVKNSKPLDDFLDNLKAEITAIEEHTTDNGHHFWLRTPNEIKKDVLAIIDKYNSDSEVKNE